jgi:hypothetical protein
MNVQGCDCSIVIKTSHKEINLPYSEETIREAVSILQEEAAIEGDGTCKAIRKICGVTGCVVSPLTIGTAPLLLFLAMGAVGNPVFVSETRNLYQYRLRLLPFEDTDCFDLVQDRSGERKLFEACRIIGFELRIVRDEAIKLKLDICGNCYPVVYPYTDTTQCQSSEMSAPYQSSKMNGTARGRERFNGDFVSYKINGIEYQNIYGLTLSANKESGTKTELWIRRSLKKDADIPEFIEEMVITAQLARDKYEYRYYGTFRITVKRLFLISDETDVNSTDTIVGSLRYYVAGTVCTEVFTSDDEGIT